ncbi:MAG: hypothetical protein AABY22_36670 [Nanoarchaeota archaeon]
MTKPTGKYQKSMYNFLKKYPGEWHSYSQDSLTKKTISSLRKKGLACTNKYHQMKLKEGKC